MALNESPTTADGETHEMAGVLPADVRMHDRYQALDHVEPVLTGGHERPTHLLEHADLVANVRKEKHPIDAGQRARRGTEY